MKRLGAKKTKTRIAGHQDCGLCHPKTKAGRSSEEAAFRKKIKMTEEQDKCPGCKSDLVGEPIPEKYRHYYGNKTHFSRKIALVDREKDRATHYKCPDCKYLWGIDV